MRVLGPPFLQGTATPARARPRRRRCHRPPRHDPRAPRPGNDRARAPTRAPGDLTRCSAPPAHPTSPPWPRMRQRTPSPAPTASHPSPAGQGGWRNQRRDRPREGREGTRGASSQRRATPPQAAPRAGEVTSAPARRVPREMRPHSTVVRCRWWSRCLQWTPRPTGRGVCCAR